MVYSKHVVGYRVRSVDGNKFISTPFDTLKNAENHYKALLKSGKIAYIYEELMLLPVCES